ncbi:hypothetical protein AB0G15_27075 [Streptosporangium sp. NPDC023825]|uniref:hypothetical protein n=1 Tax=Streptosporangium sp. NPDC023825 TaxID=3154909 RepID=UPI00344A82C9
MRVEESSRRRRKGTDMRTWRKPSKLAAAAMMAGCLALTGTSAAVADANPAREKAALTCGAGVFLDGLRALTVTENGRDEVYITSGGTKIWPVTSTYVSMAAGQRVEVDKCVPVGAQLRLMEYDDLDFNDLIGGVTINRDATWDYEFCCGDNGRYRLGAVQ